MKKIVLAFAGAAFLAGCTTDPYTGQQKVSNMAGGAALGALAGAGLGVLAGGDDRRDGGEEGTEERLHALTGERAVSVRPLRQEPYADTERG